MANDVDTVFELLRTHEKIMVFTGAGVSVDSGIPDFRSGQGIWSRIDPMTLSRDRLMGRTGTVESFWKGMYAIWSAFGNPEPNPTHRAIASLQAMGRVLGIVTQNIDGLHQQGGSSDILEIHGSQRSCICLACARTVSMDVVMNRISRGETIPTCLHCHGQLRPQIVLFGDPLSMNDMNRAQSMACRADLCLVLGSSLVVHPAADLPRVAYASGAKLVILTIGKTPLDALAHHRIDGPLNETFVPAVEKLKEHLAPKAD